MSDEYATKRGAESYNVIKAKMLKVGYLESDVFEEYGQAGARLYTWPAPTNAGTLSTDATLSTAQLIAGAWYADPAAARTLTLPTGAAIVAAIKNAKVGLGGDLYIINNGTVDTAEPITLTDGASGTSIIGNPDVMNKYQTPATHLNVGSGHFRWRIAALGSSPSVVFYRLS